MQAVVFHGIGDIRVDDVPEPELQEPTDAIVRLTATAICGTDLHFVRGTMPGTKEGRILGHEGVGVVEQLGEHVRNLEVGDRVVIPSTIACGTCSYCRAGSYAQCDRANPSGEGTAFFGGPEDAGGFDGAAGRARTRPVRERRAREAAGRGERRPGAADLGEEFERQIADLAPSRAPEGPSWQPGSGPSQVLQWAVQTVAKAGTVCLIGVYPPSVKTFPIGEATMKTPPW